MGESRRTQCFGWFHIQFFEIAPPVRKVHRYSQKLWAPISMLIHLNEWFDSVGPFWVYSVLFCFLYHKLGRYSAWHSFESFLKQKAIFTGESMTSTGYISGPPISRTRFSGLRCVCRVTTEERAYSLLAPFGPAGETRRGPPSMWEQHAFKKNGVCEVFCSFWSGPMSKMCVDVCR